ncbi:MAG: bifunctional 5,10-methylene-tetrahydrofolate dehydrogenase/5,10-methylene-tetrahydrofolate cyclohydrolase, partial [Acidobacteria bacterium]|nr:bifunctional 5,10-methylene-tetrahydrofolate dehydrogenase/5,10-methylene-tetrahydrofolate cyclohydrolase [Acidobacteriota bacterium]
MPARIIDGKAIAEAMRAELAPEIEVLKRKSVVPSLSVVLVGENPASQVYVRMKGKACEKAGMRSDTISLAAETPERELLDVIDQLNRDDEVHGILVQLPLPTQIDEQRVLRSIRPDKDVDGFHPENIGKVSIGDPTGFRPATPYGVQQMLLRSGVELDGAHVVIVGRSNIVGRPMASLLLHKGDGGNATVTVCHSRTRDL